MVTESFSYWVEIPEAVPVKFEDLAFLIADALHSTEFAAAAAAINLEDELAEMVSRGTLKVRDSLTMGEHKFPIGDSLRNAILLPHEIRPLLESRGIGLRLKRHGSGPERWTMEHAAKAIGDQQGLHQGARDSLVARMVEAAETGALAVLDPHTDLPYRPNKVQPYYDLVKTSDIDAWLGSAGVTYRLGAVTAAQHPERSEQIVAWYDATLDADHWFAMFNVTPLQAALLLSRQNPNEANAEHRASVTSTDETTPEHFLKLQQRFDDLHCAVKAQRSLRDWLAVTKTMGLKYHPWIDKYLNIQPTTIAQSTAGPGELPKDPAQKRTVLLKMFRALDGRRSSEAEKGRRGALADLERKTGIDSKNLGESLDRALEEERRASSWSQLAALSKGR